MYPTRVFKAERTWTKSRLSPIASGAGTSRSGANSEFALLYHIKPRTWGNTLVLAASSFA